MAPTVNNVVGTTTGNGIGATKAINLPTMSVGDTLVMCVCHEFTSTAGNLTATGWTRLEQDTNALSTFTGTQAVFSRVCDGTEAGTITVSDSGTAGGSDEWLAIAASISGASGDVDVHAQAWASGATNQTITTPSISGLLANSLDIRFGLKAQTSTGMSPPSGYTTQLERTDAGAGSMMQMATKAQAATGSWGAQVFTTTESANAARDGGFSLSVPGGGASSFDQALTATTATVTASIARSVAKSVTATATSTATVIKSIPRSLYASVTSSATMVALRAVVVNMTATTVSSTASFVRQIGKRLTGTLTAAAVLTPIPDTKPVKTSLQAADSTVTIGYDQPLQTIPGPSPSEFVVSVNGFATTVSAAGVSGSDVLLTIAASLVPGDNVQVSYTP